VSATPRSTDRIVAAVAILREGQVLAGRRVGPPAVRGGWEFPGGSVEPGETPAAAAVREAREELGVEVALTGSLGRAEIRAGTVLQVFTAVLTSGEPAATGSHDELRWVGARDLDALAWLAPDRPLLAPLGALLAAAPPADQAGGGTDDAAAAARRPVNGPSLPRRRPSALFRSRLRRIVYGVRQRL